MDSGSEEPRKHPVPVPFCEAVAEPIVPELSLISLEDDRDKSERKSEPFSGTQFQTYNAWRWKYMNSVNKIMDSAEGIIEKKPSFEKCNGPDKCFLIKDKYSSSDAEKRKNEILYGYMEEPRQPILPKTFPVFPKCPETFLSGNSSDDITLLGETHKPRINESSSRKIHEIKTKSNENLKNEQDNSNNLYQIISEQNKQIEILQQQMEQIFKLQDVKDKQISQLLKSQESKEKKIELLLKAAEGKDQEIEKLMKSKEKQDQRLKDLLIAQEKKDAQNMELTKLLKAFEKRQNSSVGTMTDKIVLINSCTNTNEIFHLDTNTNKTESNNENSCLRNLSETNEFFEKDRSISLHSVDLPAIQEQVPSPQSSIHLDIQDFHYSSGESDSETGTVQNNCPPPQIEANHLGYTFYNNIITQVKDIIQNSGEQEIGLGNVQNVQTEGNCIGSKRSSMQSFQTWEVLGRENIPPEVLNQENQFPNRLQYDSSSTNAKDFNSPSDISLKINSLALKYLKQEQISQYNLQSQMPQARHPDVTIYNVTNLSFGSTRMDRCRILPRMGEQFQEGGNMIYNGTSNHFSRRRKKSIAQYSKYTGTNFKC